MATASILPWLGFNVFVVAMIALDLVLLHRRGSLTTRQALGWTALWVSLALAFAVGLYAVRGSGVALEFLAGYVIEYSLSADNIFVFVLIFSFFAVPSAYQHRVLLWGVLGALVMRAVMILVGSVLIQKFHWVIYVFGAFLVFTGIRMAMQKHDQAHPDRNPMLRLFRRFVPVTSSYEGDKFMVRQGGRLMATPLLLVLIVIETTDLVFAVDSIPAIFAVTSDPFVVYTSNVFAVLGLRSLYFVLAGAVEKFHYLKHGLSVILTFVGVKMLLSEVYKIPVALSLVVIIGVLLIAVAASALRARSLDSKHKETDLEAAG